MIRRGLGLLIFALIGLCYDLSLAMTLTVTAPSSIVRAGPGKTYNSIGKVAKTEQYEVMEERDGWYKIQLEESKTGPPRNLAPAERQSWYKTQQEGNKTGWVSGKEVALDQTSRGLTIISAARSGTVQRRFALVIGNTAYLDNPLRNPRNDATDMDAMLRQLGFEVTLLLDANYRTMKETIQKFTTGIPQGSMGLFYFSGHGMQMAGENYLIPIGEVYNGASDVEHGAVKANWVLGRMEDAGMDVKLIILDACRNNPMGRSGTRTTGGGGLAPMDAVKGSLIAYSTSPGQTAADGTGRNSPYTAQMLQQLPTPGQPVETMFKRVRVGVQQETKDKQIPWESSSLTGDFYFGGQIVSQPASKEEPQQLGGLSILGRVPGAEVWVGTDRIGETRTGSALSWENLKPGNYRVAARKPGYETWEREVTVGANQRLEVMIDIKPLPEPPAVKPEADKPRVSKEEPRQLGGLAILGRVPGVEVWVGTDRIGETRTGSALSWENLKPGNYRVAARKPGYELWEQEVTVVANQRLEVMIDIKPLPEPPAVKPEADKPREEARASRGKPLIVAPTP